MRLVLQRPVPRAADDADHANGAPGNVIEVPPLGGCAEVLPRERFIDDAHRTTESAVTSIESAPLDDRQAERLEIPVVNHLHIESNEPLVSARPFPHAERAGSRADKWQVARP